MQYPQPYLCWNILGLGMILYTMFVWWRDVILEYLHSDVYVMVCYTIYKPLVLIGYAKSPLGFCYLLAYHVT
jgi:hypothetical protein